MWKGGGTGGSGVQKVEECVLELRSRKRYLSPFRGIGCIFIDQDFIDQDRAPADARISGQGWGFVSHEITGAAASSGGAFIDRFQAARKRVRPPTRLRLVSTMRDR